ncbi:unnamed protein product [Arctogadus glacialis]
MLSHQNSSLRSASKTDQPQEISCNDVTSFKCHPANLFSRAITERKMPRVRKRTTSRGLVPAWDNIMSRCHATSRGGQRRAVKPFILGSPLMSCPFPASWSRKDWITSFMERSSSLPLRRPEATSQQRLSSFNQNNVNQN